MKFKRFLIILLLGLAVASGISAQVKNDNALVFMSDFKLKDGAVSAMKGVAYSVDSALFMSDLTHEIPEYDIWTGGFRLYQTANYWPEGTVFVTVVDPGVGTERQSIVLKTKNNRYFVGPNNGIYTLVADRDGIEEIRIIDETKNRLPGSADSYTFFGRDVFAYTGARLASGKITLADVGPLLDPSSLEKISYQKPERVGNAVKGMIPVLDDAYGNVWTNIPKSLFSELGVAMGGHIVVKFFHEGEKVAEVEMPYVTTFGDVPEGEALALINSLYELSFAINMGNFSEQYSVSSGAGWSVEVSGK